MAESMPKNVSHVWIAKLCHAGGYLGAARPQDKIYSMS